MIRRGIRLTLRARILIAVGMIALIALAAAGALVYGVSEASEEIERTAAAHRRVELLGNLSSRINDYALLSLQAVATPEVAESQLAGVRVRVADAFALLDRALRDAVDGAEGDTEKTALATRSITVARMHARFDALDRQVEKLVAERAEGAPDEGRIRVELDTFASAFAPLLGSLIDEERRSALIAQENTEQLRDRLVALAAAFVAGALVLSIFVYVGVARPLIERISAVARAAGAIGGGRFDTRLSVEGRDELTLLMASFNRMAARLARREQKVMADRARLTEIIEANTADLRAANRRLEETDAARRRFFADVSHELRTPLTVILGEADVTLRAPDNDETSYRNALTTIRMRARRLRRRVEDLLRVARSETGQIEFEFAAVSADVVAAEAAEDVSSLARTARVRVDLADVVAVPPVKADADWIRQVVGGILDNAIRHSPQGSIVRVSTRAVGDGVEIAVTDEGPGVPPDVIPHVFERFYRGRATDTLGYGIGLALAKWVVEQHHGTIEIRSPADGSVGDEDRGPGTVVTVRLPVSAEAARSRTLAGGSW